jgi:DHA2 family multidrug resistance protein
MIEKAAFAASANEAWLLLACFALLAALLVPFCVEDKPATTWKAGLIVGPAR